MIGVLRFQQGLLLIYRVPTFKPLEFVDLRSNRSTIAIELSLQLDISLHQYLLFLIAPLNEISSLDVMLGEKQTQLFKLLHLNYLQLLQRTLLLSTVPVVLSSCLLVIGL